MKRLLTLLACCAVGAAGCGGGGGATTASTSPPPKTSATVAPTTNTTAEKGGTVTVDMKDIKFVPDHVDVKAGQAITWTNRDGVPHTVTADRGASFDSGTINPSGTYTWKATNAGQIHYYCTIHGQNQSGTITVK